MEGVSDVLLIAVALIYTTNTVVALVLAILKHRRAEDNAKVLLQVAMPILQQYLSGNDGYNVHGEPQQGNSWDLPSFQEKGQKVPSVYAEQVRQCNERELEAQKEFERFIRRMPVGHDAVKGDD